LPRQDRHGGFSEIALRILQSAETITESYACRQEHLKRIIVALRVEIFRDDAALLSVEPSNLVYRNNYALALFKTGQKEKAVQEFRQVLQLNPNFKAAQQGLEVVLQDLQQAEKSSP
jgi:tetratricopeptide (TPR) repeat protein